MIRQMMESDSQAVLAIYGFGLETRNATFETEIPPWHEWKARHHPFCRFVFEDDGEVRGWAALAPVSSRPCYAGVAEVSMYIAGHALGRGIASALMKHLIEQSEAEGIWSLYASIFPENIASHRLLLRHGFREIGRRERIAQLDGHWRDTLLFERRSETVGT